MIALFLALGFAPGDETHARWHCEPAAVEVGEPFALVLELRHPRAVSGRELAAGELALDESWVVLGEEPLRSAPAPDEGQLTRRAWRVASLEPGERTLADALAGVALSEHVARIQVGEARVSVRGLLEEGEDEPRPLREFPEDFAVLDAEGAGSAWAPWLGLALGLLAASAGWLVWRRRGRTAAAVSPTPLERLGALERELQSTGGRGSCFELTRVLREASDELCAKPRGGLTDEEWLAEVRASLEIPRGVVSELALVLESAARVKYAGDAPTPWALQEIFARARATLTSLGAGEGRA